MSKPHQFSIMSTANLQPTISAQHTLIQILIISIQKKNGGKLNPWSNPNHKHSSSSNQSRNPIYPKKKKIIHQRKNYSNLSSGFLTIVILFGFAYELSTLLQLFLSLLLQSLPVISCSSYVLFMVQIHNGGFVLSRQIWLFL